MATTNFREDYIGRDLVAPTSNALDYMGRATTTSVDYMGRSLRRILRANLTAYALGDEIQFTAGAKFIVVEAGTSHSSAPQVPDVGDTVVDGSVTLLRQK